MPPAPKPEPPGLAFPETHRARALHETRDGQSHWIGLPVAHRRGDHIKPSRMLGSPYRALGVTAGAAACLYIPDNDGLT
jgi:hypothetical protein